MQVQKLQNNNTAFKAKLNIIGTKLDEKDILALSEDAKKIGFENDVIEFRFAKIAASLDRHDFNLSKPLNTVNDMFVQFMQLFSVKYIPQDTQKSPREISHKLIARELEDIWKQQMPTVKKSLDDIAQKYAN